MSTAIAIEFVLSIATTGLQIKTRPMRNANCTRVAIYLHPSVFAQYWGCVHRIHMNIQPAQYALCATLALCSAVCAI